MSDLPRLLIVDDEPLVRHSLRTLIDADGRWQVAGEARNGSEAVSAYGRLQPDLVLMDLQMPLVDGIEATGEICTRWPDARVVVVTALDPEELLVKALAAGALGFILKDSLPERLMDDLQEALAGDPPLSGPVRRHLIHTVLGAAPAAACRSREVGITEREREVLECLAKGLGNREIGKELYLSEGSVKQYLMSAGHKLGARSRTQILLRALQLGIVDLANPGTGRRP